MEEREPKQELVEVVACAVCGCRSRLPFFEENGFDVVRCAGCGLVYCNAQPPREALRAMYDREDWASAAGESFRDDTGYADRAAAMVDDAIQKLAYVSARCSTGRLLDVGCGDGYLVGEAARLGFDARGVELSATRVERAQRRGLVVDLGELAEQRYLDSSFDVVTAVNVLSHLRDPLAFLGELARILAPGGTLVLETGNKAELETFRDGNALFDFWGAPAHLFFFGERQLRRALNDSGFEVLGVERLRYLDGEFSERRLAYPGRFRLVRRALIALGPVRDRGVDLYRRWWYGGRPESAALYITAVRR